MKKTVSLAQAGTDEIALPVGVQKALGQLVGVAREGLLAHVRVRRVVLSGGR